MLLCILEGNLALLKKRIEVAYYFSFCILGVLIWIYKREFYDTFSGNMRFLLGTLLLDKKFLCQTL